MIKNILAPTDFSRHANMALKLAVQLAEKVNAKLIVCHIFKIQLPVSPLSDVYKAIVEGYEEEHLKRMYDNFMKVIGREPGNVIFKAANYDFTIKGLNKIIDDDKIDLVVMGTLGASGIEKFFLGSNTAHLIERTDCPVLAVPKETNLEHIKKIAFSTKIENFDAEMNKLRDYLEMFSSDFTAFYVKEAGEVVIEHAEEMGKRMRKILGNALKDNQLNFKVIENEDVVHGIDEFIDKEKSDLLILFHKERNFLERLLHRSISKELAFHAKIPVLAM